MYGLRLGFVIFYRTAAGNNTHLSNLIGKTMG